MYFKVPVMMAGSIQLVVPSQLRLCERPTGPPGTPMWFILEVEEDEEEEDDDVEFGMPPKLMLMFGRSALRPSCHSFTFMLSTEPLFSPEEEKHSSLCEVRDNCSASKVKILSTMNREWVQKHGIWIIRLQLDMWTAAISPGATIYHVKYNAVIYLGV